MSEPDLTPTPFVRFDVAGAVTEFGIMGAENIALLKAQGERIIVGKGDFRSYVCLKRMKAKLKSDNPTRLEGMSLLSVPKPSTVTIDRTAYEVADGRLDLEFEFPGTYRVEVRSAKHLPAIFEVTV